MGLVESVKVPLSITNIIIKRVINSVTILSFYITNTAIQTRITITTIASCRSLLKDGTNVSPMVETGVGLMPIYP